MVERKKGAIINISSLRGIMVNIFGINLCGINNLGVNNLSMNIFGVNIQGPNNHNLWWLRSAVRGLHEHH